MQTMTAKMGLGLLVFAVLVFAAAHSHVIPIIHMQHLTDLIK